MRWKREEILFSSCNEDSRSELQAFGTLEGRRVLCVTAGGGRVLNLLAERPREVVAVDLNPAQNRLLELKIAAMRALDHDGYLGFLGVRADAHRLDTYERLVRPLLEAPSRTFFDARPAIVRGGVLLQGRLERYLRAVALVLGAVRGRRIRRLFSVDDLATQRRDLDTIDRFPFRDLAHLACRRTTLRLFSGDPGFYAYVPPEIPLHRVIYDGVFLHLRHHLARDNPLMQLIFCGRWVYEPALPIYLNRQSFAHVKAALADVGVVVRDGHLDEALGEGAADGFDAFSLSDVTSYLDDDAHDALFESVLRASRPGARVCSRSNLHARPLAVAHARRIERDRALEDRLAISDHSCVHKFVVGRAR